MRDVGTPCDLHAGIAPTRLRTCIIVSLLPEAPRTVACDRREESRARCRVTGARGDVRMVELITEVGAFRVLSSETAGP